MGTEHLLLVERDAKVRRLLKVSLEQAGYDVTTARDGSDALTQLDEVSPALVLAATDLPKVDGYALVRQMREEPDWADIPVIFMVPSSSIEDRIRGLELGVDEFLTKPIFVKEVLSRVQVVLAKRVRARLSLTGLETSIRGSLDDMPTIDLFESLESGRQSGEVKLRDGRRRATVYFQDGEIIDAEMLSLRGEEVVYRLLCWVRGSYEVRVSDVDREDVIESSTRALLEAGMRHAAEFNRARADLPRLEVRLSVDEAAVAAHREEIPDQLHGVLALFDGDRTITDILDRSPFDDISTLTTVSELLAGGLLRAPGDELDRSDAEPSEAPAPKHATPPPPLSGAPPVDATQHEPRNDAAQRSSAPAESSAPPAAAPVQVPEPVLPRVPRAPVVDDDEIDDQALTVRPPRKSRTKIDPKATRVGHGAPQSGRAMSEVERLGIVKPSAAEPDRGDRITPTRGSLASRDQAVQAGEDEPVDAGVDAGPVDAGRVDAGQGAAGQGAAGQGEAGAGERAPVTPRRGTPRASEPPREESTASGSDDEAAPNTLEPAPLAPSVPPEPTIDEADRPTTEMEPPPEPPAEEPSRPRGRRSRRAKRRLRASRRPRSRAGRISVPHAEDSAAAQGETTTSADAPERAAAKESPADESAAEKAEVEVAEQAEAAEQAGAETAATPSEPASPDADEPASSDTGDAADGAPDDSPDEAPDEAPDAAAADSDAGEREAGGAVSSDDAKRSSRKKGAGKKRKKAKQKQDAATSSRPGESSAPPPTSGPVSSKPPSLKPLSTSGLSEQFFASSPPVSEDEPLPESEDKPVYLTDEQVARKQRFQKLVTAGLGALVAAILFVIILRAVTGGDDTPVKRPTVPTATQTKPQPTAPEPSSASGATPAPTSEPAAGGSAGDGGAGGAAAEGGAGGTGGEAEGGSDAGDLPDVEDPLAEAAKFLNVGNYAETIPMARAAVAKDPENGDAYFYLGLALQESGKREEAADVWRSCLAKANKGQYLSYCKQYAPKD